jgi:hypothetical protein
VTWSAPLGATGYDVYYDSTSSHSGSTTLVDATHPYPSSTTNVTSGGTGNVGSSLSAGTTYYFRVAAKNSSGYLLSTNELSSVVYQNFTMSLPYDTLNSTTNYSLSDASRIEITSPGIARLKPADQTDDANDSGGFGATGASGATMNGTTWDTTSNFVRLNTTTNTSELDSSWTPQWSNLIGYWKLNETSGTAIADSSPNATPKNGTISGTYTLGATGKLSNSIGFNSGATVDLGANYDFTGTTSHTISLWFKSSIGTGAYDNLLTKRASGDAVGHYQGWVLYIFGTNGALSFERNNNGADGAIYATNSVVNDGQWHMGTFTYDGTNMKLYVDGALAATSTHTGSISSVSNTKIVSGYTTSYRDDVAIWSTALTASEVATIYARQSAKYSGILQSRVMNSQETGSTNNTWTTLSSTTTLPFYKELPGTAGDEGTADYSSIDTTSGLKLSLDGYWKLNGTIGIAANNSSAPATVGANGTVVNTGGGGTAVNYTYGALNEGVSFNKSVGYVNLGKVLDYTTSNFTISFWIKLNSYATSDPSNGPIPFWKGGYTSKGYYSQIMPGGQIAFSTNQAGSPGTAQQTYSTGGAVPLGSWQHLTYVRSGSSVKIYVNGKNKTSTAATHLDPTTASANDFVIGSYSGGSIFMSGAIDEFAAWSRALTAAEVLQLYRRGGNRIKYQLRTCTTVDCNDQEGITPGKGWKGPGGNYLTYFSELYNTASNSIGAAATILSPTMTFSNFGSLTATPNPYFQYRAIFESDDANSLCSYDFDNNAGTAPTSGACSPELKTVAVSPNHYNNSTIETVLSNASPLGSLYETIDANGFTESLGTNSCSAGTRYSVTADNGSTFYYWNSAGGGGSGAWETSTNYATANDSSTLRAHISTLPATVPGTSKLQIKAYLKSDGTSPCEIDSLTVTGKKF